MNVLITGAAGGLGRAFANECAQRGYTLFLTDINEGALEPISAGIRRRFPVEVRYKGCDLTSDRDVDAMLACFGEAGLPFDMLLNVAGVDFEGGFTELRSENILDIVRLNIEATLRITHKVLERRAANRRFYLAFVSSLASLYPMPLKATYAASKRFLLDFSLALGQELKPFGVSVLSLCPGGLATTGLSMVEIAAQGFWGNATTNRLESVAHRTVSRVLRGRRVYIPGALNYTFGFLGKLVPRSVIVRLIHARWQKARASYNA